MCVCACARVCAYGVVRVWVGVFICILALKWLLLFYTFTIIIYASPKLNPLNVIDILIKTCIHSQMNTLSVGGGGGGE